MPLFCHGTAPLYWLKSSTNNYLQALEKSKYEQSLESVRHFIAIAEKELDLYHRHIALYGIPNSRDPISVLDCARSNTNEDDDESNETGSEVESDIPGEDELSVFSWGSESCNSKIWFSWWSQASVLIISLCLLYIFFFFLSFYIPNKLVHSSNDRVPYISQIQSWKSISRLISDQFFT